MSFSPFVAHALASLKKSAPLLVDALEHLPANVSEPIGFIDTDGVWRFANAAAAQLLRVTPDALVGKPMSESGAPSQFVARVEHAFLSEQEQVYEICVASHDNRDEARVHLSLMPHHEANGVLQGVLITSSETDLHSLTAPRPKMQYEMIEHYLDQGPLAFVQFDARMRVQKWSLAAQRMFGWTPAQALGRNVADMCKLRRDDLVRVRRAWHRAERTGDTARIHVQIRNQTRTGDTIWCDWYGCAVQSESQKGSAQAFMCFAIDVTERVKSSEAITQAAHVDALTGLPNRRAFYESLDARLRRSSAEGSVLFIDLDGFKETNDKFGHKTGDQVLRLAAQRIRACLREHDVCARYGGDEFVAFVSYDRLGHSAASISERIVGAMQSTFDVDGVQINLSCSVGVAVINHSQFAAQRWVGCADLAMYEAKRNGKDQYAMYTPALNAAQALREKIQAALKEALQLGQVQTFFQARVAIATGQIIGAEALVRWPGAAAMGVGPAQFMPVAEEMGLIHDLGAMVLQRACECARAANETRLPSDGLPFVVSVNVSNAQLRHPNFARRVRTICASTGCRPQWIEFELTESRELNDAACVARLNELVREVGVRCSLDDFGAGYSKISELVRLPLTAVKIDRSFLNMPAATDVSALSSIVTLAKGMGMRVVAQGVDSQAEFSLVARLGCESYQGLFHSRPMPFDHFFVSLRCEAFQ